MLLKTQAYMLIPILLWIEYAFGSAFGTLGVALAATVAVIGTAAGHGPFVVGGQNEALLALEGFIGIVSIATLVLDAALRERRQALADLTGARDELEQRVHERTVELRQANDALLLQIRGRNQAVEALQRETLEHHRTEEALRQSQKLEALGQLTGGVAHDFNNLLLIIGSNLFMLRRRLGDIGTVEFDAVDRALARAESLTRQLLTFGRRQALQPRRIDLAEHLPKVAELVRHLLPGNTRVRLEVAPDVWSVDIDPNEFELAVINIAVNAKDAMPGGGVLTVTARNEPRGVRQLDGEIAGDCVSIAVRDTGAGIPDAVIARVFEPFFTTKEPGKGTGLGLSQVYGFARQSGGTATVASREGEGTTLMLYLPRASSAVARAAVAALVPLAPLPLRERAAVLVVEDNPEVAEVSVALLETLGYGVTQVELGAGGARCAGERQQLRPRLQRCGDARRHERRRTRPRAARPLSRPAGAADHGLQHRGAGGGQGGLCHPAQALPPHRAAGANPRPAAAAARGRGVGRRPRAAVSVSAHAAFDFSFGFT